MARHPPEQANLILFRQIILQLMLVMRGIQWMGLYHQEDGHPIRLMGQTHHQRKQGARHPPKLVNLSHLTLIYRVILQPERVIRLIHRMEPMGKNLVRRRQQLNQTSQQIYRPWEVKIAGTQWQ
ncbi:TPA: hypothetical protein ACPWZ0_003094 [Salmonella enterica subsp. enterica serovar Vietnam]|nr:hypothetical protein [Salmonella enterica]